MNSAEYERTEKEIHVKVDCPPLSDTINPVFAFGHGLSYAGGSDV